MLILEKTATATLQKTPYMEYQNVHIENLGKYPVRVALSFVDLRKKMIDEGAVMDIIPPYSSHVYENMESRKKRSFWGLLQKEVTEIGFVQFKTENENDESDLRITAYNGHIAKIHSLSRVQTIRDISWIRNSLLVNPHFDQEACGWYMSGDYEFLENFGVKFLADKSGKALQFFPYAIDEAWWSRFYFRSWGLIGAKITVNFGYTDETASSEEFTKADNGDEWHNLSPTVGKLIESIEIHHKNTYTKDFWVMKLVFEW